MGWNKANEKAGLLGKRKLFMGRISVDEKSQYMKKQGSNVYKKIHREND